MSIDSQNKIKNIEELLKQLKRNIDWENLIVKLESLKQLSEKEGFWERHQLAQKTMKEMKLLCSNIIREASLIWNLGTSNTEVRHT